MFIFQGLLLVGDYPHPILRSVEILGDKVPRGLFFKDFSHSSDILPEPRNKDKRIPTNLWGYYS